MNAQALPYAADNAAPPRFSLKDQERRHNRLHYRAQLATLLEGLAAADLTATTYRVMLDTLARMLRQGRTTEAVTSDWMATRLGVGRNAISAAYGALEARAYIRRVAVKHRGAPTRTRLIGICAGLIDGQIPATFFGGAAAPVAEGQGAGQGADTACDAQGTSVKCVGVQRTASESTAREDRASEGRATDRMALTADAIEEATRSLAETQDAAQNARVATTDPAPPARPAPIDPAPVAPFVFNATINQAMTDKVPSDMRLLAMQARSLTECPIQPAWGLTEAERRHYLALIPKREPRPAPRAPSATLREDLPPPTPELTAAWRVMLPKLKKITGSDEKAFALADQISYQVVDGDLGKGNALRGIRVGVSLVEQGLWTEPHRYLYYRHRWAGNTQRSMLHALLAGQGDARQTVH